MNFIRRSRNSEKDNVQGGSQHHHHHHQGGEATSTKAGAGVVNTEQEEHHSYDCTQQRQKTTGLKTAPAEENAKKVRSSTWQRPGKAKARRTGFPARSSSSSFWARATKGHQTMCTDKVLFLDVDGVLNTEYMRPRDALHGKLLGRLGEVVNATGAKVVLSSTWRLHPTYRGKLMTALEAVGVDHATVVDDTPQLPLKLGPWPPAEQQRAAEIAEWIRRSGRPDLVWAAVDDLDLSQSAHADLFNGHFVRTAKESGLSELCASRLLDILQPVG